MALAKHPDKHELSADGVQVLIEFARSARTLCEVLTKTLNERWKDLTENEQIAGQDAEYQLLGLARNLLEQAAELRLNLVQQDIETLKNSTESVNEVVESIRNIKSLIEVAASVVAVGIRIVTAASTGNVGSMLGALGALNNTVVRIRN